MTLMQKAARRIRRTWLQAANNRRIKNLSRQVALNSAKPQQAPVIFFNASTRLSGTSLNAGFSLLVSWSLRLAGTPVIHFVCRSGLAPCVLGTSQDDPTQKPPCKECILQSRANYENNSVIWFDYNHDTVLEEAVQTLSIDQMQVFSYHDIPLGQLVLPSLRWILRLHHLEEDEQTRLLYRKYLLSAFSLAKQFERLLDEIQPQAVVVFNGMFYPEATARWVARQKGIKVISHEVGLMPFSGFFTQGEATAYPIDIPDDFLMTEEQNRKLDEYLRERFKGNFSMAGIRFWPQMHSLGEDFWGSEGIFSQVVTVFTNVVFDTSQGHANVLFSDMFAWLDCVLEFVRRYPQTLFIIRAHPDEFRPGKESRESVAQWVEKNHVKDFPNVRFVDANESVSSYELIQKSKFVLVYNSTIGLEASILGAAVVCAGKARFTQLPTVFFPESVEEFRAQVAAMLDGQVINIPPEFQENARRFLYYQLFRCSLPFGDFLEDDGIWKGYVKLKTFQWQALLAQNSATLCTIQNGILENGDFLYPE